MCYPFTVVGLAYGRSAGNPDALHIGLRALQPGAVNQEGLLSHLWFLYYLLYYYAGAVRASCSDRRLRRRGWRKDETCPIACSRRLFGAEMTPWR